MFSKIALRFSLIAGTVVGIASLSGAADASTLFVNITSQKLVFDVACAGDTSSQSWTVDPHSTGSLYCRNGASSMQVTIRTQHDGGSEVVRSTVFDGRSYDLGYDDDGDVSIERRGA